MLLLGLIDVPLWLILLIAIVATYLWRNTRHFSFFKKQGIPGLRPVPVLGTIRFWGEMVKNYPRIETTARKKYGDFRADFLGSTAVLTVYDESFISQVLVKDFNNFCNRPNFAPGDEIASNMVSNARDAHWKKMRTIMSPAFSTGKLRRMMGEINRCAGQLADYLVEKHGQEMELKDCAGSYALDVIASTAFGMRLDSQKEENSVFVKYAKKSFNFNTIFFLVTLLAPFLKPVLRLFDANSFIAKDVREFFTGVVKQAVAARKEDNDKSRVDFLQLMINAQSGDDIRDVGEDTDTDADESIGTKSLTDQELIANSVVFFVAAYDTAASSVAFLLYNLALNPACQETLVEEISTVVGDTDVKYDMLSAMPYLEQCVYESLRIFPPVPDISREVQRDVTINGIHLKKGMMVKVSVYGIHHDDQKWPDPETFIPERFSSENKGKHGPFDWMPFGYGPRNCVATRLALIEVKMAVIHVLRKVKVAQCEKTQIPISFKAVGFLQPSKGIWLKVENRKKNE